ncbi:hypothetical protein [Aneurinibacillus aneurinilyticus]|uniref:ABC transporter permease n=2 Tax=Aneurinibacillus aneurinilyticus TaxID=1391 RepID=A0A848CZV1_ANEAE|nr:hypothetical protein [Aneurinibacillus aneurinilyticus]ERI09709.1 hypothetical protein HMPREF0083_02223 [Aneurinibacillus aneurinilyticus ATCC 12856]MED0708398.1 ABC transporter permease [Aneurinibacillus aneurinilyticus]MED0722535.1 ABC transporter permease [Aneurinibacillus aneurinilyticus]MED0732468.1 ABC transporter permease [Aneurinibacillus aneurinilyticus]MED0741915.1 ABC transporter permease [Aneurinibacillus aneurinilyticus]
MLALMKSEWERMWGRKKTKYTLLVFVFLLLFECYFLWGMTGRRSFYDPNHVVHLNSLNTAPFLLRELALYLHLVLIPMLVVDSFNAENTSGALRMVLLRPIAYTRLVMAKWLVLALLLLGIVLSMLIVGTLFAKLAMPYAETVAFLNTDTYTAVGAFIFSVRFYSIAYIVLLAVLGVGCFVSTVLPHPILSYSAIVGLLIGSLYVSSHFLFFLGPSDSIFQLIGGVKGSEMYWIALVCAIMGYVMTLWIWRRRDWMN